MLSFITFFTRVVNLLNIPIFTDEAIYIRWAQIGLNDPAHRYIALTDGKQPLLTWLMYPSLMIFKDPLFAWRFISVLSGVFAVIGLYLLSRELFNKRVALVASIIHIISPFFLLYDRLALMDSLLSSIGIWSIYLTVLLVRRIGLDIALLLGMSIGLGVLTKTSAFFYLYLLPLSILLFDFKKKERVKRFMKWVVLVLITTILAQVTYNSLRLSPWFYIIEQKNYTFIYTFSEFLKKPFAVFLPNLHGLWQFLSGYLSFPLMIVLLIGISWGMIKMEKKIIYLSLLFLLPFTALAVFGKVLFPRFILFMVPPLLIIIAQTLSSFFEFVVDKKKILIFVFPIVLLYPAYQSYFLMTSPLDAAIPENDRNQLFDDWPSGYGVKEVISYLAEESKKGKVVVGTEGTFGLFPASLEIYLGLNQNIEVYGFWPVFEVPKTLLEKSRQYPTYLIFKEKQIIQETWPLKLVAKYRRGKGETYLLFYQVMPNFYEMGMKNI